LSNERWLRWAVGKHFRDRGLTVNMRPVKVGNAAIDGEVIGQGWKMALEIISSKHDVIRDNGQCTQALASGYQSAALVTSVQRAKRIKPEVFHEHLVLLGIDAKGMVHQVYP
jgi:hypothetical protein